MLTVPLIVLPAEQAQFSALIDGILATADLSTISAKKIRKELQAKLTVDISDKKVGAFHFTQKSSYLGGHSFSRVGNHDYDQPANNRCCRMLYKS